MDKLKIELTLDQLNVVFTALGKLPLEQSVDVFMVLRMQAESQLQNQTPAEPSDGAGE